MINQYALIICWEIDWQMSKKTNRIQSFWLSIDRPLDVNVVQQLVVRLSYDNNKSSLFKGLDLGRNVQIERNV